VNIATLWTLLEAARVVCGHTDYVVVGSLSILGMEQVTVLPTDMTMSIDADCYTRADPPRIFDLQGELGEGSAFHMQHGIYLDPVSPKLPTLPDGWESRLIAVKHDGLCAHFLEPHDAAISKLARGEARDLRWVRAGIGAGMMNLPTLALRIKNTRFLDAAARQATTERVSGLQV